MTREADTSRPPHDPVAPGEVESVLSVIIPIRNDPANLTRCIASLRQSRSTRFEILVVDDASNDHTPDAAEALGVRVIRLPHNGGPARARNIGAEAATGSLLLFIDADVRVNQTTLERVIQSFEDHPEISAVFGSYCDQPEHRGLISQYRNLLHHFVHQSAKPEATTFWSGCGAVRRDVFLEHKGFSDRYARPCIEDIELGIRLNQSGKRILLNREIQATHLKQWTLRNMIKTDVFDRGIPWTRLLHEHGSMPDDLNLRWSQRISALLAVAWLATQCTALVFEPVTILLPIVSLLGLLVADRWRSRRITRAPARRVVEVAILLTLAVLAYFSGWWALAIAMPLVAIVLLNAEFYRFLLKRRSLTFTLFVVPLHVLYLLYSVLAFAMGTALHWRHVRPDPPKRSVT